MNAKKVNWKKLDTASNIFLAARSAVDSKVFRLSAAFYEEIDKDILQTALDKAYENFSLYHYVLRGGMFWHYLEESTLRPVIEEETDPPCSKIYDPDMRELLFRVSYHKKRLNLEVFHALSDGAGAIKFFELILYFYCKMKYPNEASSIEEPKAESDEDLMRDGFDSHFAHFENNKSLFGQKIGDATGTGKTPHVYHAHGTKTPDLRMKVLEVLTDSKEMLKLSKSFGVSLTVFLTSLFLYSVYLNAPRRERLTISASVPVNLRKKFPTESARNFFSTMIVSYTFLGNEKIEDVAASIKTQFEENTKPETLRAKQQSILLYERNKIVKLIPRVMKDFGLRIINAHANKKITVSASNVGTIFINPELEKFIHHISYLVAAVRPQFVACTFGGILSIGFTDPFQETAIYKNFVRFLTDRGIKIELYSNNIKD